MSAFTGVQVFGATMVAQRQTLGETVTRWIEEARRTRPGFEIVAIVVRQSSDRAYHLISIVLFYNETVATKTTRRKVP